MEKNISLENARKIYKSNPELLPYLPFNEELLRRRVLTWKEYCKDRYINGMFYCAVNSNDIIPYMVDRCYNPNCFWDAMLSTTEEIANAKVAFSKLITLRDEARGGWKPDFSEPHTYYSVHKNRGNFGIMLTRGYDEFFLFETEELAEEFLDTNADLFEQIKGLY